MTLYQVEQEITRRLVRIFPRNEVGKRLVYLLAIGLSLPFQLDPLPGPWTRNGPRVRHL